jgi:hypothetical protein
MGGWVDGGRGQEGGVRVYESYEVKNKRQNYAVFYFAGKRIFFIYL